jgi:ornithine carbamoyltransferase
LGLVVIGSQNEARSASNALKGKTVGLVFQKPSTRTAVSFSVGVAQLGGTPLLLNADVLQIKRGESPKDTARVLSRYLDAIVIRAHQHDEVMEMSRYASIPVINGLTNKEHPCQVLADLLTIMEHRGFSHPRQLTGFTLAYLGDGNNVAQSWMLAGALLGMNFRIASPPGYHPEEDYVSLSKAHASKGATLTMNSDPKAAATGADALYTDVWTSMGQESESMKRRRIFSAYQLNRTILNAAKRNALVMHCLPAHRGEEITEDVLEGPHSVVFDQAEIAYMRKKRF